MEIVWRDALWPQFGAAIDVLDNALVACPDALWEERIWPNESGDPAQSGFGRFWTVSFHTLFWLDLYLSGDAEHFTPPAPFERETDDYATARRAPYTREQLRAYLAALRARAHATLGALTEEQARRPFVFPWRPEQPISHLELMLYTMRHTQEHGAHLSLFLGQHGVPGEALDWVSRARADGGVE